MQIELHDCIASEPLCSITLPTQRARSRFSTVNALYKLLTYLLNYFVRDHRCCTSRWRCLL